MLYWLEETTLALTVRDSLWLTVTLSAIHLVGVTLVGGAAVMSGLRAGGLLMRDLPLDAVGRPAIRMTALGLLLAMSTGLLLVLPRVSGALANEFFEWKMTLLSVVIVGEAVAYWWSRRGPVSRPLMLVTALAALGVIALGAAFILLE